ncbi:MAG: hypothetical protein WCV58_00780 [Patescibacteria group bacterium]|jgi:hypothetical protein
MSWLRRTIIDDAKDFETQLQTVKIILFKKAENYFESKIDDKELAGVAIGKVVCYLTGEDLDANTPEATEFTIEEGIKIKNDIPGLADGFMKSDKIIRELTVYTLRMRSVIVGYIFKSKGLDFFDSQEFERMNEVLQKYGAEFPEEVSPKFYAEIVNREMKKDMEINNKT